MAAGVVLPAFTQNWSIVQQLSISYSYLAPQLGLSLGQRPWTPPQYSKPALTVISVPGTFDQATGQPVTYPTYFVFDAVLKINHRRVLVKTQHPVLTGASISDHAYMQPNSVTLEIGMSDAMAAYAPDMWVGASTKSISAWQVIENLQVSKTLLTLVTRLDTYPNMIIETVTSTDTNQTLHGLRATITLGEIISAGVTSVPVASARPQTTDYTAPGVVQGVTPDPVQQSMHQVPDVPTNPDLNRFLGAGDITSNALPLDQYGNAVWDGGGS